MDHLGQSPPLAGPLPSPVGAHVATWNIRSLTAKYPAVSDTITSYNLDLLALTETWHSAPSDVAVHCSALPGYSFLH